MAERQNGRTAERQKGKCPLRFANSFRLEMSDTQTLDSGRVKNKVGRRLNLRPRATDQRKVFLIENHR